jgi:pimeloyl-ACP methyl ester carboxylesterase
MGGWWASGFAVAHPERVRALAITNTVGGLWTDALRAHFATLAGREAADAIADTETHVGVHTAVGSTLRDRDLPLAFLYQQLNTFHTPPMHLVLGALAHDHCTHDDVRALAAPKLWISASDDPLFPAALVRESAERVGARFEVIDDAGHSPYFERATEWNAIVLDFLTDALH